MSQMGRIRSLDGERRGSKQSSKKRTFPQPEVSLKVV